MDEIELLPESKLRRLRNLRPYKDLSDEEISQAYTQKRNLDIIKGEADSEAENSSEDAAYERRFNQKMELFKAQFAVDMNDSNDAMSLVMLARHSLQSEDLDKQITAEMRRKGDSRNLKNLGDVQRSLVTSIKELQDSLGISRKTRKEEQTDDIPRWISETRQKALDFWQRKTIPILCESCQIELARFWLNFADSANKIEAQLECPQCKEKVVFTR